MAGNAKKQPEKPAETDSKKSTSTRFLMFRFSPEKRGAAIKVFIAGVLALLMFSQVISSYMQLNEVYSSISDANSELSNLRSENVRMQTELEGKASIRNIKDYAENHLGLQKLDQSQIQYIEIQKEDTVEIDGEEQNIFVRLKHKCEDILAYLRGCPPYNEIGGRQRLLRNHDPHFV